jgi:tRNA pseudouridine13 synthase
MSTDLLGALGTLPRQQLHLYLHAYQSYIFNHACTHRLTRMNATQPVEGDLVLLDNSAEDIVADDEVANVDDGSDRESTPEAEEQESNSTRQRVRMLSAADIASGQYSITDIVLPLIGSVR